MPGDETANREDIGILNIAVRGCNDIHVSYGLKTPPAGGVFVSVSLVQG